MMKSQFKDVPNVVSGDELTDALGLIETHVWRIAHGRFDFFVCHRQTRLNSIRLSHTRKTAEAVGESASAGESLAARRWSTQGLHDVRTASRARGACRCGHTHTPVVARRRHQGFPIRYTRLVQTRPQNRARRTGDA